ncbi:MAG: BON domain-containing protein [Bryobacteraceae bacterium]
MIVLSKKERALPPRLIPALVLFAALAGAGQSGRADTPAPKTEKSDSQSPSDSRLERAIRARFARSKIAKNAFAVEVRGGVATLTGRTGIVQHKGTATRLARSAGAAKVVNQIQVAAKDAEEAPRARVKPR